MKFTLVALILTMVSVNVCAADESTEQQSATEVNTICLLSGMPPSDVTFSQIKKLKIAKHGYGSVNDVLPELFGQAKKLNADAIIGYNGAQRFGFWPWQFVRPTASGIAVNWQLPEHITCEGMGGTYKTRLNGPLTTDA